GCGSVAVMTEEQSEPGVPRIPDYLLDPRPVVIIGTVAWTLALLAEMLLRDVDMRTVILCAVGVGVGALGTLIYAMQRRAVLRGRGGGWGGLDFGRPDCPGWSAAGDSPGPSRAAGSRRAAEAASCWGRTTTSTAESSYASAVRSVVSVLSC